MVALTEGTDFEVVGVQRGDVFNTIVIKTIDTVDATNTLSVDMTKYGISATGLLGVRSYVHTTASSVVTTEANTCSVSSGTITVTIAAGTDNDNRYILIEGFSVPNPTSAL